MLWKIVTLPRAREDYASITYYLSGFYPGTPRRFHEAYVAVRQRLKENPRCCSPYLDNPTYRRALIGKYTMLYKIDEERHEVHIHRILRSNWNIPAYLQDDDEADE